MQCEGEYWIENDDKAPRATQVHKLTSEEREHIPTENMESEWYLAKFEYHQFRHQKATSFLKRNGFVTISCFTEICHQLKKMYRSQRDELRRL